MREEAQPGPTDVGQPQVTKFRYNGGVRIERNDLLFTLRADRPGSLFIAVAWFAGRNKQRGHAVPSPAWDGLLRFTSSRPMFVQMGLPRRSRPARPVLRGLHPAPVADVDGLRRPAGRRVGPGSAARLTTAARGDYFDNGSIQHLSHVILDMLQFFDMGSDAEPPGADGMFIERVQYMFHSPAIAAGDKDPYANGGPPCCRTRTAAPSRRTNRQGIGTTGAPPTAPCTSAWTDRDTTPWTSPAAGLSPSSSSPSSVPTAEFFRTLRTSQASLDLQDKYGVRAQDNGLERFLTATRRQNLVASGIRCKRTGAVPVHGDVRR